MVIYNEELRRILPVALLIVLPEDEVPRGDKSRCRESEVQLHLPHFLATLHDACGMQERRKCGIFSPLPEGLINYHS